VARESRWQRLRAAALRDGVLPSAVYAAIVLCYAGFEPIWDGQFYMTCFRGVLRTPGSLEAANCYGHPSAPTTWVMAALLAAHGGPLAIHLLCLVAGIFGLFALARLLRHCGVASPELRTAAVTAFAVNPEWLAGTLHVNLDHFLLVGLLWVVCLLLEGRRWPAAAITAWIVFTKETGLVCIGLATALYAVMFIARRDGPLRGKIRDLLRLWPMALAVVPVASYLVYRRLAHPAANTVHMATSEALRYLFTFDPTSAPSQAYAVTAFVLNFTWLVTIPAALFLAWRVVRWLFAAPAGADESARKRRYVMFLGCLLAFVLTRVPMYNNARYYLPAVPFLIVVAAMAVEWMLRRRDLVLGYWCIVIAFATISIEHTVDPVSRRFFGTFPYGSEEFLNMTSRTREYFAFGRDQLVYNLQFTHLPKLWIEALRALPDDTTAIVVPEDAMTLGDWAVAVGMAGSLGKNRFISSAKFVQQRPYPAGFWYWEMPNAAPNVAQDARRFAAEFERKGERVVEVDGYAMVVSRWESRTSR
jgi:hypothetical protein